MTKPKRKTPNEDAQPVTPFTLRDLLAAVEKRDAPSVTRRRDLRSAVTRVASLLDDDPAGIPLDLPAISARLATVSPVAAGLHQKDLQQHPVRLRLRREDQRIEASPAPSQDAAEPGMEKAVCRSFRTAGAPRFVPSGTLCQRQGNCAPGHQRRDDRRLHHQGPRSIAPPQAERPAQNGLANLERGRGAV